MCADFSSSPKLILAPGARRTSELFRVSLVLFARLARQLLPLGKSCRAVLTPYCPETRRRASCGLTGVVVQHATKA